MPDVSPRVAGQEAHSLLSQSGNRRLSDLEICPSLLVIRGPAGEVRIEPKAMLVLEQLAQAAGSVVSRAKLMEHCWPGVFVGDDACNRAIFVLRRGLKESGSGVVVETIPRSGYRLVERSVRSAPEPNKAAVGFSRYTRRTAVAALVATAATAGTVAIRFRQPTDRVPDAFEKAMTDGRNVQRQGLFAPNAQGVDEFREAVRLRPDNAEALGLLAIALRNRAEFAQGDERTKAAYEAEAMAARALALDPAEPNAVLARGLLRSSATDWASNEDLFRQVLRSDPDSMQAMIALVALLQAAGRVGESWRVNERAVTTDPLAATPQFYRAQKLWIYGRSAEAEPVLDRADRLWPDHPWLWNARFVIYSFSNRTEGALAMLDAARAAPALLTPEAVESLRIFLHAVDTRSDRDLAAARGSGLLVAKDNPGMAAYSIMFLSYLNEVDAAYEVLDGFLFRMGPLAGTTHDSPSNAVQLSPLWRRTQWMFTPATNALRADARFPATCRRLGLLDYWRRRGLPPRGVGLV